MSTLGPTHGLATVTFDSQPPHTIDTNLSSAKTAEVVDVDQGAEGAHEFTVTVQGTPGNKRIDVDALIVLARI
jgi:hypothetical protein